MSDINREVRQAIGEAVKEYSQLPTNTLLALIWGELAEMNATVENIESLFDHVLEKMEKGVTVTGEVGVSNKQDWNGRPEPLDVKVK